MSKNDLDLSVLNIDTNECVDNIDATLFSGGEFHGVGMSDVGAARRRCLRAYCERWLRRLDELDRDAVDSEVEQEAQ